jgi:hypothetical protein
MLASEVIMRGSGKLIGFRISAGKPCWTRDLSLCFLLFFTFWVTSWKSAREALTRGFSVLQQDFQRPKWSNGLTPQHSSISAQIPCIRKGCI